MAIAGLLLLRELPLQSVATLVRTMAALLIIILGVSWFGGQQRPFARLEALGAPIWSALHRRLKPTSLKYRHSYYSGLVWGFLPCGLIYGVVLTAVFSNTPSQAALITLGFGLGTVPSLVLTGTLYQRFRRITAHRWTQRVSGAVFILGGLLMLTAPWWVDLAFVEGVPELVNLAFCLT